jgi:hypothetical protein
MVKERGMDFLLTIPISRFLDNMPQGHRIKITAK